jgi:hypothetical protein
MRNLCRLLVALSAAGVLTGSSASAGTITGLGASPSTGVVGETISVTATGTGLCGAVHINWGDGEALTYATTELPVTRTHVYKVVGAFTVRAQGMGNCDGEAVTRVSIRPHPDREPPPARPRVSGIELAPTPVVVRTPVVITLQGAGACRVSIDFGDGNAQEVFGDLPIAVRHTYSLSRVYTIVADPADPCGETRSIRLEVVQPAAAARLTGVQVTAPQQGGRGMREIRVDGTGTCSYSLDYGDGNTETRSSALPEVVRHNYPAGGRFEIVVHANAPCSGTGRATFDVGIVRQGNAPRGGSISSVEVRPRAARQEQPLTMIVRGTGTCRFTVDFGDGEFKTVTETLPHQLTYRYASTGEYEVYAWAEHPCAGDGTAAVRVRR